MVSTNVKADVKQIKELVAIYILKKKNLPSKKIEMQCKQVYIFNSILLGIPSNLFSMKNREAKGV